MGVCMVLHWHLFSGVGLKWPLGTCRPLSRTSVSHPTMGVLYNLSKPQYCPSINVIHLLSAYIALCLALGKDILGVIKGAAEDCWSQGVP